MRDLSAAVASEEGEAPAKPPAGRVVAGQFGGPLSARAVTPEPRPAPAPVPLPSPTTAVPAEFLANMDRELARLRTSGEKLA